MCSQLCSFLTCVLSVALSAALIYGFMGGGSVPIQGVPPIPDLTGVVDLTEIMSNFGKNGTGLNGGFGGFPDLPNMPDLSDVFIADPEAARNGTDNMVSSWQSSSKKGLQLTLVNALTDDWTPFFNKAVDDWNDGTPKALRLTTETASPDTECSRIVGKMKVCNGNYGNTEWKGINEFMTLRGYIVHSVAKMNEFHLANKSDGEKQYTMCHEMGHGFGLGHWDENFLNQDLGSCLDYTIRPQQNQQPGQADFDALAGVYGYSTADDRRRLGGEGMGVRSSGSTMPGRRSIPHYRSFDATSSVRGRSNWRLVRRHGSHGAMHELDLGDGFKVHARVLLHDRAPG